MTQIRWILAQHGGTPSKNNFSILLYSKKCEKVLKNDGTSVLSEICLVWKANSVCAMCSAKAFPRDPSLHVLSVSLPYQFCLASNNSVTIWPPTLPSATPPSPAKWHSWWVPIMIWEVIKVTNVSAILKVLSLVIVAVTRFGGGDFHDSQIFIPPAPQVHTLSSAYMGIWYKVIPDIWAKYWCLK